MYYIILYITCSVDIERIVAVIVTTDIALVLFYCFLNLYIIISSDVRFSVSWIY